MTSFHQRQHGARNAIGRGLERFELDRARSELSLELTSNCWLLLANTQTLRSPPVDNDQLPYTDTSPLLSSPHLTVPYPTPLTASLFLFLLLFLSKLCCEAHRLRLKSASLRSFFHVISKPLTEGSRVRTPHDCDSFTAGN